jgi:hypothetical protein
MLRSVGHCLPPTLLTARCVRTARRIASSKRGHTSASRAACGGSAIPAVEGAMSGAQTKTGRVVNITQKCAHIVLNQRHSTQTKKRRKTHQHCDHHRYQKRCHTDDNAGDQHNGRATRRWIRRCEATRGTAVLQEDLKMKVRGRRDPSTRENSKQTQQSIRRIPMSSSMRSSCEAETGNNSKKGETHR